MEPFAKVLDMRSNRLPLLLLLFAVPVRAQQAPRVAQPASLFASTTDPNEGIWDGYEGEWRYASRQIVELAEAIPESRYSWRPGPGVRSVSEVFMHIALANFYLLSATGPKVPPEMDDPANANMERTMTTKPQVVAFLKRSLTAVANTHAQLRPGDGSRKVVIEGHPSTVDLMYLRILAHANEHMGQMIAYARINGVVPPWSRPQATGNSR